MMTNWIVPLGITWIITLFIAPKMLPVLRRLKFGQQVREDGPESHLSKQGTPTMGGLIFLGGILLAGLIFEFGNGRAFLIFIVMLAFGLIGLCDDGLKIKKKQSEGLSPKQKILLQVSVAFLYLLVGLQAGILSTDIIIPFYNGGTLDLGGFFIPLMLIVILGTVNGVNLTDGLDGLATTVTSVISIFFVIAAIILKSEHVVAVPGIVTGALLAFLLFNTYPAQVFMGDTGSLALGGFVASMAIYLKLPLFILIFGGIYVVESLSVIIQVGYYKRNKKRIFKMAPIHHHFELSGMKETQIVAWFTVITIMLSLIGLLAL